MATLPRAWRPSCSATGGLHRRPTRRSAFSSRPTAPPCSGRGGDLKRLAGEAAHPQAGSPAVGGTGHQDRRAHRRPTRIWAGGVTLSRIYYRLNVIITCRRCARRTNSPWSITSHKYGGGGSAALRNATDLVNYDWPGGVRQQVVERAGPGTAVPSGPKICRSRSAPASAL